MNCPNCGSPVDAGAAFCNGCGANLAVATQQPINTNQNMQQPMNNVQQPVNNQPMNQQPMNNMNQGMVNNQQPYQNNSGSLNFFKYMISVIIKPYDTYKTNESKFDDFKNSIILSIILVVIMGVANALTSIIAVLKLASEYGGGGGEAVGELLKRGEFYGGIGKLMLLYIATIFIAAGVYFLASLIVKKDVKFPKLLGIAATALIPGGLIVCVLAPLGALISGTVAEVVAVVGIIYSVVVLIEIINDAIVMENKNSRIYLNINSISIILLGAALLVYLMKKEAVSSELSSYGLNMIGLFK